LETARDLGLAPSDIRDIVCAVLQRRPNRRNWSEYPNVWEEAQEDVYGCQWFQVYDIIEKIWNRFKRADDRSVWDEERAPAFRQAINDFFLTNGIGWQLVKGEIVMFSRILARAITGDPQATLGEILKKHPDLLPRPLYEALSKVWFCFDGGSPSQGRSAAETGGSRTSGRADRRGGDVLEQKM
jgi:AbiJ N-terminal domain 4